MPNITKFECTICKRRVELPCNPANDNKSKEVVVVACDEQLKRKSHYQRLGIAYSNLPFSRRAVPDFVNDTICDFLNSDRKIRWADGRSFVYRDEAIETAFRNELNFRWISDLIRTVTNGGPKQSPQDRVLERMRLLDLALRIKYPSLAQNIAK